MIQNKTQVATVNFRLYFKVIFRHADDDFEIKMTLKQSRKFTESQLTYVLFGISQDVLSFRNLLFT